MGKEQPNYLWTGHNLALAVHEGGAEVENHIDDENDLDEDVDRVDLALAVVGEGGLFGGLGGGGQLLGGRLVQAGVGGAALLPGIAPPLALLLVLVLVH